MQDIIASSPGLACILTILENAGHRAHLVGGALRNALTGHAIKDYDIATSARPETVRALFADRGFRVLPTGIAHGTLSVIHDGEPFEITTWRRDVATDGRRATIAYADQLEDDAMRRDFTFNALYMDLRGTILDPTQTGLQDAAQRRVRFIGCAQTRIREDALRILRYFRFVSDLGAPVDPASPDFIACRELSRSLCDLSRERVGEEIRRILGTQAGLQTALVMHRAGILDEILPMANQVIQGKTLEDRLTHLHNMEFGLGLIPSFSRRLAAFQIEPPKHEFALSRAEVRQHDILVRAMTSGMQAPELGYRLGAGAGTDALCLAAMLGRTGADAVSCDDLKAGAGRKMPIRAADLAHVFSGPALGAALASAEAAWIASDFTMTSDDIIFCLSGQSSEPTP